jgi:GntR family transcriptional regulator
LYTIAATRATSFFTGAGWGFAHPWGSRGWYSPLIAPMRRAVDRSSPVPCYVQIVQQLRDHVLKLPPGHSIFSERELAERYGVSRMTAREAVRILRHEGLLYHERGRGMFVTRRKLDLHDRHLLAGFSEDMRQRGHVPSSRLLRFDRVPARGEVAAALEVRAGEPVYRIERLRLSDDVPMAHESTHVPLAVCPTLYRFDLARDALYRVLRQEFGLRLARATEELEAASSGRTMAKLFGTTPSDPVLSIRRVVYTADGRAVETTRSTYRADRYRASFQVTIEEDVVR